MKHSSFQVDCGSVALRLRSLLPAILSVISLALPSSVAQAAPAGYTLLWEDNFDGNALDLSKWGPETNYRHMAQNTTDAISVKDGLMTITTYTEAGKNYTGFLTTHGKFETTFGYFEARIRFHTTPGQWAAFWVHTPTMGKPMGDAAKAGTEIDIVEHRARDQSGADLRNMYVMNLHWDGYQKGTHKSAGGKSHVPADAPPLQDNWHTYALLWTPERYTFFLDGSEQWTSTNAVSHRSEYVLLSCEVNDKNWAGNIPTGGFGSRAESRTKMEVDWVRVWQPAK